MASEWFWNFRWPSKTPTVVELLRSSRTNIERINSLTSHQPLNLYQCRSMSSKLLTTLENIEQCLAYVCDGVQLLTGVFESFYLVSERAKELVESCCSKDWCQASTFQIQNEEAFREILLETSLCYSTIFELVKDKVDPHLDLRGTSTFDWPALAEVSQDRRVLQQRYQDFVDTKPTSESVIQKQHLAKYLLSRSRYIASQSSADDFGNLWPDGKSPDEEWGNSDFLGGNVCRTTWMGVPCAKKVFEQGVLETEIFAEARILARLNHPNIVKFICWGKDSKMKLRYFIAMEQMEEALSFVIRQQAEEQNGAPFPLRSAVDIMLQIAYGTCYLHENGIAHRDLKTSNVVVSRITTPHLKDYLRVKLVDFGLSKVKLSASRSNTISRPRIGTTAYMPPEAFHEGRANWFKADVYSFGMTCSAILSGHEPFQGIPRGQLYEAVCSGVRPRLPPETPEELASLVERCWDTDRNARPDFVDICTRLAKLRHKLLREDPRIYMTSSDGEVEDAASLYIQEMFKKRSDSRKPVSSHFQLGGMLIVRKQDQMLWEIVKPMTTLYTKNEPSEHSLRYQVSDCNEPTRKQSSISLGVPPPDPLPSRSLITSPPPPVWVPMPSFLWNSPQSSDTSSFGTFIPRIVQLGSLNRGHQATKIMPNSSLVLESNASPRKIYDPRRYNSLNDSSVNRACAPSTSRGFGTTGVMPVEEEPIEHYLKSLFNETVELTREKSSRRSTETGYSQVRRGKGAPAKVEERLSASKWELAHTFTMHTGPVHGIAVNPSGNLVATASWDHLCRVYDVHLDEEVAVLAGHLLGLYGVKFSPAKRDLVGTVSSDQTCRLWSTDTGECLCVLEGHTDEVNGLSFKPGTHLLATASDDATSMIWDPEKGVSVTTLKGHQHGVYGVCFQPNGGHLVATASFDFTAKLWDPRSAEDVQTLRGHLEDVIGVDIDDSATYLATGSDDKTCRVWDLRMGHPIVVLQAHSGEVKRVVFSPYSKLLATTSADTTVRLFDTNHWNCAQILSSHFDHVFDVAWSPTADFLVTASHDRFWKLWQPRVPSYLNWA